MATHQADIMALIRDILVQQLADPKCACSAAAAAKYCTGLACMHVAASAAAPLCIIYLGAEFVPCPHLLSHSSAVHGVLASLPNMTPDALQRFAQQLLGTGSEKVQRDITKRMLVRPGERKECWLAGLPCACQQACHVRFDLLDTL